MENKKELRTWLDNFGLEHPLVIAGPCSAETEEQVLKIAHQLKDTDVNVLRAGIWKPRTRPGNFEGVGALGLKWLQKAKEETGMLTTTEVANPNHVELAMKHDIDILWIGARTTVSPFIIQEIADALKGTDKVVLVKNPVNPDLSLWLGAVERLYTNDIKNLGVIHRGFSTYEKTRYRNNPEWQIPIDLQTKFPDLPLILDPSHIAGNRTSIFDLCQTALDLNYDGIMVETHHDPDNAWSDAAQQITPATLVKFMQDLRIRKEISESEEFQSKLQSLRAMIDIADTQLLDVLSRRMKIADEIGRAKKAQNVAILQNQRWSEILGKMTKEGEQNGLSEDFIMRIFKAIHQESINHQEEIMKKA
ncbi:bifunctional 3-deoxy-7-phosphoheptulonate synthase/chorismate mutase type II [Salinimicrobium oceani]|uniref:chorismate mutase n=1 Tax=Salinimicrobium oceani TaxID=2722702 RepID=A0ABX1D4Z0_9FLAO|nr:bifunctional 3-deoxy-7-phosphoheptulonate synthase/chorismate mutase type II [Salinimicrobium oceani]NJW54076.1 bifunctional 3-deoxy-7-phosphoheptulonate synthase/chorismate mutase type II [Salinimicrobium oceani]